MNILWTFLVLASMVLLLCSNPSLILSNSIDSIYESLKLCFTLLGIYMFWLGIIRIMQDSGLGNMLAKILKPFIIFLFGANISKETAELISINISANLLGLGNASLPAGLKAMHLLDNGKNVNFQMIMLFALNCCSIQLLPSSVILMRSEGGSSSSGDIILPVVLVSLICCAFTILMVKTFFKDKKV